jgi:6-phosphogluconolactonase (cycloisomerase 2 family)
MNGLSIENVYNCSDSASLNLYATIDLVTTVVDNGATYLITSAVQGFTVFAVGVDGKLTNTAHVVDYTSPSMATAEVGGKNYLFLGADPRTGYRSFGEFSISPSGAASVLGVVYDDTTTHLMSAKPITARVGDKTYLFVKSCSTEGGVSVYAINADGSLINTDNVADTNSLYLGAGNLFTTAVAGGSTYLFAGEFNGVTGGISEFRVSSDGQLTNIDNFPISLPGYTSATSAMVGGNTYLFVKSDNWSSPDTIAVYSVGADGGVNKVGSVTDDAELKISGPDGGLTTAVIGGSTYLFAGGNDDSGVSIFEVSSAGSLTDVANIADNATFKMQGIRGLKVANVGGKTFLFTGGWGDSGVSVFQLAPSTPVQHGAANDFNGDRTSDALWRNTTTGAYVDWTMADGKRVGGATVGAAGLAWSTAGTGDFNGDGSSDLLLRNSTSGRLVDWDIVDGVRSSTHAIGTVPLTWTVVGTGDFNGDGTSEILWRNSSLGKVVLRGLDNGALSSSWAMRLLGPDWNVVGVGDFNGDGASDILLEHSSTGWLADWQVANGKPQSRVSVGTLPSGSTYVGNGDFLGNGTDDLLIESYYGALSVWEMHGEHTSTFDLGVSVPSGFEVSTIGDFNGDGVGDVMLYNHATGALDVGLVSNGHIGGWSAVGTASPSSWHFAA